MAEYDIKLKKEDLLALLSDNDSMSQLMEQVLNQVLEAQMSEHLNADKFEHTDERTGYRNGYRTRHLYTRIGKLILRVPQTRDGTFSTQIFKRYQRSEQALVSALMEMYLQGVSTRKVTKITEELCGVKFSKSTVSTVCVELDARISAWKNRRFDNKKYPFIIVDALVTDVRRDHAVRSTGVLIAYGVNDKGFREVLGLWLGDSETEAGWTTVFKELKERGLKGVDFVVSDAHTGLVNALKKQFQGAQWQRCQTHFVRNILGLSPRHHRKGIADKLRLIFTATDKVTARELAAAFIKEYEGKAAKGVDCLEAGLEDALAILGLPERYRKRLRTSNMAERMNEEIRRRERVIRIFPNENAAARLIGAVLAEKHDEWQEGIRYLDMTEYWEHKEEGEEKKTINNNDTNVVSLSE
jgi:transposase-like protein